MSASNDLMNSRMVLDFQDPKAFHDRILLVGETKFYVVSGVLSTWSEYFRSLFNDNFVEKNSEQIELKELNADVFNIFLHILYENQPGKLNAKYLIPLIDLSYRFLAPNVLAICEEYIGKNVLNFDYELLNLLEKACFYDNQKLKKVLIENISDLTNVYLVNFTRMLKLAEEYKLDSLKNWFLENVESIAKYGTFSGLLDCAADHNLPEMKDKVITAITNWDWQAENFTDCNEYVMIELVQSAFKHDIQVLKDIVRRAIFYTVDDSRKTTRTGMKITTNYFLEYCQDEILSLPSDIRKFFIDSTVSPE